MSSLLLCLISVSKFSSFIRTQSFWMWVHTNVLLLIWSLTKTLFLQTLGVGGVCHFSNFLRDKTLCDRMDSSVHKIIQARILEWDVVPSSRGSCRPRDQTHISYVSCIGRWVLSMSTTWEAITCSFCQVKEVLTNQKLWKPLKRWDLLVFQIKGKNCTLNMYGMLKLIKHSQAHSKSRSSHGPLDLLN